MPAEQQRKGSTERVKERAVKETVKEVKMKMEGESLRAWWWEHGLGLGLGLGLMMMKGLLWWLSLCIPCCVFCERDRGKQGPMFLRLEESTRTRGLCVWLYIETNWVRVGDFILRI